jgi:integrase
VGPKVVQLVVPSRDDKAPTRRQRLTASRLKSLRSEAQPYALTDLDCPGLQLHVAARLANGSEGTRSWHWRFRWRGKRTKLTVGQFPDTGIAAAHDTVRQARELLGQGIDPRKAGLTRRSMAPTPPATADASAESPHSIETLTREFMARFITPNRKHPDEVKRVLDKEVLAQWPARDIRALKPRDVLQLLDAIVDRGSPIMANRVAALLKQLFKFAVHRQLIETTPVQLLYAPGGEEKSRNRALSDAELAVLLANIETVMSRAPRTVAAIRIILLTACRRSEIALAKWSHFDLESQTPKWRLPAELSKTGVECITPLVPSAVAILKKLKKSAGRSRWVFPNGAADAAADPKILTRSVNRHLKAFKALKLSAFTLHDLRRTVRTGMAKLKIAPHIAERCLNHAQPGIVAAYDVYAYEDEKREALETWADHLKSLRAQTTGAPE